MAYGFGTTKGTGTTDKFTTAAAVTAPIASTLVAWTNRNGDGGGSSGRIATIESGAHSMVANINASAYFIRYPWATTDGIWSMPRPTISTWAHIAYTYDGSDSGNAPLMYIDAASQTVTPVTPPAGTPFNAVSATLQLGNSPSSDRVWDGMLAEVALFNRVLTAAEITALAKGMAPILLPGRVFYRPMVRNVFGDTVGGTPVVQAHPRIYYPWDSRFDAAVSTFTVGTGTRRTLSELGTRMGSRQVQEV